MPRIIKLNFKCDDFEYKEMLQICQQQQLNISDCIRKAIRNTYDTENFLPSYEYDMESKFSRKRKSIYDFKGGI